ncbi:MAG: hypothetical protein FGM33_06785 [Candidatus Kapabacteria bacterium]|nr:hypothetical protein [Candidatus Kapabacteria bacterium]
MFLRITATVLLACMTVVMGAAAVHTHQHHDEPTHEVVSAVGDHHEESSVCALCKVTKERAALSECCLDVARVPSKACITPAVKNLVSDRCPVIRTGRAPPRG